MRDLLKIVEAATSGQKIDRSAFIYLPPKEPKSDFADCKTCQHFKPDSERCAIFGPDDAVTADDSCGLYLHGEPIEDQECKSIVTPEQAGFVEGPVRCENCSWFTAGRCDLYATLMKALPDVFDLDSEVDAQGCCNGWQKR